MLTPEEGPLFEGLREIQNQARARRVQALCDRKTRTKWHDTAEEMASFENQSARRTRTAR